MLIAKRDRVVAFLRSGLSQSSTDGSARGRMARPPTRTPSASGQRSSDERRARRVNILPGDHLPTPQALTSSPGLVDLPLKSIGRYGTQSAGSIDRVHPSVRPKGSDVLHTGQ